jgi:MFS transporter, SHS family, lactate transporter
MEPFDLPSDFRLKCGRLPGWNATCFVPIRVAALYLLSSNPHVVVWGFILQGAFGQAMYWLNPVYLAERFPTEVRAAASAFCYHIGAIFGGAVPPLITLLAGYHHMGLAMAMLAGIVVGAISYCLALLAGPETKGTRFKADLTVA